MAALRNDIDPQGLSEFSVVFTDRSLNHMSKVFQGVMNDISDTLKDVYQADAVALVPGGGTFAMESVARSFAGSGKMLVIRNGWFSFRWSQIVEACNLNVEEIVLKARPTGNAAQSPFAPAPIEQVVETIQKERPNVVVAPHVETSSGIILPDDYIATMAAAAHQVGAVMILDCIASGCAWIDMKSLGVDVLISAPQKGWSGTPCAGMVMLSTDAAEQVKTNGTSSFAGDLGKWLSIMQAYENGGHAYHATMPTDGLRQLRDTMIETRDYGIDKLCDAQWELGDKVRAELAKRGIVSVAADGFGAPGVVVSYTSDPGMQNGSKFGAKGMQIAAGVPLQCDEPDGFSTFRLGLFGLDKLYDVDATVARLLPVLDAVLTE
ncbi:aminotransferase class V-fold PLP-dependent enzyme [Aestuariibius sp. HNIBRBA575]|uniref:aminotransferase class V-fold PLP-dependent enzyme n=1 Tax=Aestuariibius sp. HNIBRBA575 TaxID=3233343 RepID=UPI0034A0FA25